MTPRFDTSYHSPLEDDLFPSSSSGSRDRQQLRTCHLPSLKTSWSDAADLLEFLAEKFAKFYPVAQAEGRGYHPWIRATVEEDSYYQGPLRCSREIRQHEEELSKLLLCGPPQILGIKNVTVDTESGDIIGQAKVIVDLRNFSTDLKKIDTWLREQYAGKLKHFPPYRFSFYHPSGLVGTCAALAERREKGDTLTPANTMLADAAEEYLPILLEKRKQSQTPS